MGNQLKFGVVLCVLFITVPLLASAHGHFRHSNGHQNNHEQKNPPPPIQVPPSTPPPSNPPVVTPPIVTGSEISFTAYLTSYQSGDNDPAGSTGTFINGIEGNAGGIGTYANPITLAVGYVGSKADYAVGTTFYVPSLQKYFVAGDTCADCHKGNQGHVWLDLYSGNYSSKAGLNCEDALTANYSIIENPKSTYPVNITPLFNGSTCLL